jgi:hypothetical protein
VALLEGDDYWTDPLKLQKQAVFLDEHPECSMCFHTVQVIYETGERPSHPYRRTIDKTIFTVEDLLLSGNFIQTCSVVFRAGLLDGFPDWFHSVLPGDWALHILHALHGDIGYIDEIWGVYRVHSGGVWASHDKLTRLYRSIESAEIIKQHLDQKGHRKRINNRIARWHHSIAEILYRENDLARAPYHARRCLAISPFHPAISKRFLAKVILKAYVARVQDIVGIT